MSLSDKELEERTKDIRRALTEMDVTDNKDRARVFGTAYTQEVPSRISEGGAEASNSVAAVQRYLFILSRRRK